MLSASTFRQQICDTRPTHSPNRYALLTSALRVFVKRPLIATPPERSTTYPRPNHPSCPESGSIGPRLCGAPCSAAAPKKVKPFRFCSCAVAPRKKPFVRLSSVFLCSSLRFVRSSRRLFLSRQPLPFVSPLVAPRSSRGLSATPRPLQGMSLCAPICAVVP